MQLRIERRWFGPQSTLGKLYLDNQFECYTLEDTVRAPDVKIPGKTAIPAGIYFLVLDFSPRFQRVLPHVLGVPGFEGIRIHPGNDHTDTSGCILVGQARRGETLVNSRQAFDNLFRELEAVPAGEPIEIEIIDMRP